MKNNLVDPCHTIASLLQVGTNQLLASSSSARLDAEVLLGHTLHMQRAQLYAYSEKKICLDEQKHYFSLLERRYKHEPIAYLIGYQEFWSLPFKVTSDTLIPRPETELLVATTLSKLRDKTSANIVDLGTGSGAIALAIAKERPAWQVSAVDNSIAALKIAKLNAEYLALNKVNFYLSNWFSSLAGKQFDAIVSNPPYIADNDPERQLSTILYEPQTALITGENGFSDLQIIISQAYHYLANDGWLLVEHGYKQHQKVSSLLEFYGFTGIESFYDLAGHPRISAGKKIFK